MRYQTLVSYLVGGLHSDSLAKYLHMRNVWYQLHLRPRLQAGSLCSPSYQMAPRSSFLFTIAWGFLQQIHLHFFTTAMHLISFFSCHTLRPPP